MNIVVAFLGIVAFIVASCHSYVLVQVEKGENNSDVDAFIHKEVPTQNLDANAVPPLQSRKQFTNFKRFEIRQRADDDIEREPRTGKERVSGTNSVPKRGLESVIVSIDTGAKPVSRASDKPDAVDKLEQAIADLTKMRGRNNPIYRAQQEYDIKPELVHFKSKEQPSLKFEINSRSIVKVLENMLSSPTARGYADVAGKQAGLVYRALAEELDAQNQYQNQNTPVY